jgi:DNA repair photolyase
MEKMKKEKFGTKEWSDSSLNIMTGCPHLCRYCYSKADALRWKRIKSADQWEKPVLNLKVLNKPIGKRKGVIMFPTTHDLLPEYLTEIIYFLGKILSAGNQVLIVSKPHLEVIFKICKEFKEHKDQVLFRFSIGSCYDDVLKFWEPEAPGFDERLHCLEHAFKKGWKTSVSCEPMLDGDIDDVIDMTREYVTDSIWLGKMNFAERRIKMNCNSGVVNLVERLQTIHVTQSDKEIMKLYNRYKDDPLIKWKESIRKVVDKV